MLNLKTILMMTTIAASPFFFGGCKTTDASSRVNLENGYKALDARDYEQALGNANAYLQSDPAGKGAAEALYLKGRALEGKAASSPQEGQANYAAARESYQQSLSQKPNPKLTGLLHAGIGNTSYWLEDFDTAARNWAMAYDEIEDTSARAYILYRVGLCVQRMGDFAGADQRFSLVQQQYPGTDAALKAREKQGYKEFNVQVATFANPQTANNTIAALQRDGFVVRKGNDARGMTIVSIGPFPNYAQAGAMQRRVMEKYPSAIIVP